ncbi:MAG: carboxypeptidase-like regulatory domain-containing protein [Terracidiphilus sp.]
MMPAKSLLTALLFLALAAPAAWAQSMFAHLSGTVLDSQGAAVAGAAVTVKNSASSETRVTITNQDGYFSLTGLPAANYEILVDAKGFEKFHGTGIALTGGDDRTVSVPLKVGSANVTVEVTSSGTELAQTDSGEKSYTISAADLQQLTLVSRDATEIVNIMPGAVMTANGGVNEKSFNGQTVGLNLNGPLGNENVNGQAVDVTMDGGHTFDPGAYGNSVPVTANQDMISEVKILTSNFTADNPKGPVVVNVVSKSGGGSFHGDFHFNARNHVLNSLESDEKENGITTKPNESYYYPGATIGGPVIIPGTRFNKNRNKLFFFDGYEFYKQLNDAGIESAFVMTPQMLSGDFSTAPSYGANVTGGSLLTAPVATPPGPNYIAPASGTPGQPGYVPPTPDPYDGFLALTPGMSVSQARLSGCTVSGGVLSSACLDPNGVALMTAYMPKPTTPNGAPDSNGNNYVEDITQPMNMTQNMARVDFDYSDRTKLYVTYNRQHQTATWAVGMWANTASANAIPAPTPLLGGDLSDFVSANFMHVISPTMTSETRFTFTYEDYPAVAQDPAKLQRSDIPNFTLKGIYGQPTAPMYATWGSGFPDLGDVGYQFPLTCYKKIPAAGEDLTKVIGTHTAKAGVYWEFVNNVQNNWGQWGDLEEGTWAPPVSGNMYADTLMGVGHTGYIEQAAPPPQEMADKILSFYAQDDWKVNRRLTVQYGLRFEHYGKPYSPPFGLAQFNPATYNNAPSAVGQNTGVSWHKMNSAVPLAGTTDAFLYYSPRLGAAFDVFGDGKTIVRGGYGKYRAYDSVQSNSYTAAAQTAIGSVAWSCGWNDPLCPSYEDIDTHAQGPAVFGQGIPAGTLASPNTIDTVNPNDHEQPLVTTYSVTVDQRLPWKMNVEASYVGNSSLYFQPEINVNAVPLGAMLNSSCAAGSTVSVGCEQQYRPYQNYQDILSETTAGKARFDSLEASLQRTSGFLTLMINYTYSKALSDGYLGSDNTSGYADYGVNEFYGVSPIDRPNVLSTAYVVRVPGTHGGNSLLRGTVNGWEISGITQIESGANLTSGPDGWSFGYTPAAASTSQPENSTSLLGTPDITLMPLLTCNPSKGNPKGTFINASCFSLPAGNGANGTTKMPYIPGPKYWKSDLTAIKNFKVGERQNLQFRIAGFNFLNHALTSFEGGDPNLDLNNFSYVNGQQVNNNTNFGVAKWRYGQRIVELGVKYTF